MRTAFPLLFVAWLAAAPPPAVAQAPSLVEGDLASEPPPDAAREPEPSLPPRFEREPLKRPVGPAPTSTSTSTESVRAERRPAQPAGVEALDPTSTPTPTPTSTSTSTSTSTPTTARNLLRAIEPVRVSAVELRAAWHARRRALREQDVAGAEEGERRVLAIQQELAIENLATFAAIEVRDSRRALSARLEADALAHALLAAKLAPGLPEAHFAVARAHLTLEPSRPGPVLAAIGRGLAATARDPRTARAVGADVLAALVAALLAAGAAAIALLLLTRLRLFLHDFHDLPVIRHGTAVQGALLGLALLAVPLALGFGPFAAVGVAAVAAWLYLGVAERLLVTATLLAFVATPFVAEQAARAGSFSGTLAEEVWEVERGEGDGAAARLTARAAQGPVPAAALTALAGHARRRGDLDGAKRWYDRAVEAGGRTGEVLVNVGDVHMLRGDPDAAKAAWLDAADRAGGDLEVLAAAEYNLSKLYVRQSALDQANEARRRAQQVAPELIARRATEDDFRANRYLLDVPVPLAAYRALVAEDPAPAAIGAAVRARLAAGLPAHLWPWAPLGLLALLWVVAALARYVRPSRACDKCGRPACPRCDEATGLLCGQCVNVYVKRGVVDPRDRVQKDREVRRHARLGRLAARAAALCGGGAGHLVRGEPVRGFALLATFLFAAFLGLVFHGVLPPPQPSPLGALGRIAIAVPLAAAVYALALRDLFRRTRG